MQNLRDVIGNLGGEIPRLAKNFGFAVDLILCSDFPGKFHMYLILTR